MPYRIARGLAVLAGVTLGGPASAQQTAILRVVPETPRALQPVGVEVRLLGVCGIRATTRMVGNVIMIRHAATCGIAPPPPPNPHVVSLGSLPAGTYQVVLEGRTEPPTSFTVVADPEPSDRTVVQTGIWWDPRYPGTGVTIIDAFPARRVVSFSTHVADRTAVVYTMVLEGDQRDGVLHRSSATPAALNPPTPDATFEQVGRARLLAGPDDTLRFEYTIGSLPQHSLDLQRFPL
jgi:hypothetical protein